MKMETAKMFSTLIILFEMMIITQGESEDYLEIMSDAVKELIEHLPQTQDCVDVKSIREEFFFCLFGDMGGYKIKGDEDEKDEDEEADEENEDEEADEENEDEEADEEDEGKEEDADVEDKEKEETEGGEEKDEEDSEEGDETKKKKKRKRNVGRFYFSVEEKELCNILRAEEYCLGRVKTSLHCDVMKVESWNMLNKVFDDFKMWVDTVSLDACYVDNMETSIVHKMIQRGALDDECSVKMLRVGMSCRNNFFLEEAKKKQATCEHLQDLSDCTIDDVVGLRDSSGKKCYVKNIMYVYKAIKKAISSHLYQNCFDDKRFGNINAERWNQDYNFEEREGDINQPQDNKTLMMVVVVGRGSKKFQTPKYSIALLPFLCFTVSIFN